LRVIWLHWLRLPLSLVDLNYLDVKIYNPSSLTSREIYGTIAVMTIETDTATSRLDSIDRFLEEWDEDVPELDPAVEGVVDRIYALSKYLRRSADETFTDFGLNYGEWKALLALRRTGEPYRRSPGWLAEHLNLSSGAMTNRLDRLEEAGLVRRLPDPKDRRALKVELTDEGHRIWRDSIGAQAVKEAEIASTLTEAEKEQLTALLRKLMLSFEADR
jgi:DNA-binding MarR family transcriptional regulator